MKEFGSDFHFIAPTLRAEKTLYDFYPRANLYADGRQALIHLYQTQGWKRLWVPEYFCYEVIDSLKQAGLDLCFYADWPGNNNHGLNDNYRNELLPTDAILRVNYFGTRSYECLEKLPVAAVVEDHTHDLIGGWARFSTADWCIASLRKSLPLPEGGILWSPKGLQLPMVPFSSEENERIAANRWEAMKQKKRYLDGEYIEKAEFRADYVNTEGFFNTAPVCALDKQSKEYLKSFDVYEWYERKRENWGLLKDIKKNGTSVLYPCNKSCYPFSLVLLFDSIYDRERVRKSLLDVQVYPAVLWNIPANGDGDIFKISRCMLSIHCDGRYNAADIQRLKSIIESII